MKASFRFTQSLLLVARLVLVLALLIALVQHWGHDYVEALLPLYRLTLNVVLPDYRVVTLDLLERNNELIVAAHFVTTQAQTIGTRLLPAGVTLDASTLASHAFKHLVIVFGAVFAWPRLALRERAWRCLFSLPWLLLLEIVDIPLAIAGAVQDLVYFNLSADYAAHRPLLVAWLHMLDGGGRLALPLLVAALVGLWRQRAYITRDEVSSAACHT